MSYENLDFLGSIEHKDQDIKTETRTKRSRVLWKFASIGLHVWRVSKNNNRSKEKQLYLGFLIELI